jgi:hypothetical protein
LFSNEFARRYGDRKIVSISLFSGAVNADLQGYAGSFFHRAWRLMGACICFIVSGGDLEALTEDIVDKHHPTSRGIRAQAEAAAQRPVLPQDDDDLDSSEPAKVDHRAITSLFAGTATQAGRMNGKVCLSGPSKLPLTLPTNETRKLPFSISPPGHASHVQVIRRLIPDSRKSYGIGLKNGSRETSRSRKRSRTMPG